MMNSGRHPRGELAAFVLGSLDPTEEAEVRRHVEECRGCRAELSQLTNVRSALSAVPAEAWPSPPRPSDVTLMQLLRRLRQERRQSRRRLIATSIVAGVAAAAVVALAVIIGVRGMTHSDVASPQLPPIAGQERTWELTGTQPGTHVTGEATVVGASWGSRIYLELHGVPAGERCRLVVYDDSGKRWTAGSWTVTHGSEFYWSGAVAIPGNHIARVAVVTTAGQRLLRLA
jgi:Putative zinc-finger